MDGIREWMRIAASFPRLNRQQMMDVASRAAEDCDSRNLLVTSNLGLVISMAFRLSRVFVNMPMEDIVQEGNIGLIRAASTFDPGKGFEFSTWAAKCIKNQICGQGRMFYVVRPPNTSMDYKVKTSRGSGPRYASQEARDSAVKAAMSVKSADSIANRGGCTWEGIFGESEPDQQSEEMALREDIRKIKDWLGRMPMRKRLIMEMRFGLDENRPSEMEYRDIAKCFGITDRRVHQIVSRCVAEGRLEIGSLNFSHCEPSGDPGQQ